MSELDGIKVLTKLRDIPDGDRDLISDKIFLSWFNSGVRSAQQTIDYQREEIEELQEKAKSAMSERDKLLAHIKALEHAAAATGEVQAPGVVETQETAAPVTPDWREKCKIIGYGKYYVVRDCKSLLGRGPNVNYLANTGKWIKWKDTPYILYFPTREAAEAALAKAEPPPSE